MRTNNRTILLNTVSFFSCRLLLSYNTVWVSLRKMNWKANIFLPPHTYTGSAETDWPLSTCTLRTQLYLASCHLGLIFFPSDISKLHNAKQISFDAKARSRRMSRPACFSTFRQPDKLLLIFITHCWRVKFLLHGAQCLKRKKQMQYLGIAVQSTVNNFQIQQLSAPLIFTQSKLFPLQFGLFFFLIRKQRQS